MKWVIRSVLTGMLLLTMVLTATMNVSATVYTDVTGKYEVEYMESYGGYAIVYSTVASRYLTVPSSVVLSTVQQGDQAFPVVAIDCNSAGGPVFYGRSVFETVKVSNGIQVIGLCAFRGCDKLTDISLPTSVTTIGGDAFSGCTSLPSVILPDNVTYIGSRAFYDCTNLRTVNIPSGVTYIGSSAFMYCSSLSRIVIPDGVTTIGDSAFAGCTSLEEIVIPASVTSIGSKAFAGCTSLTDVTVYAEDVKVGRNAFDGCTSLKNVTIKAGSHMTSSYGTFSGLPSIEKVVIEDGVTLDRQCFYECDALSEVTIGSGVTIGDQAFYNDASLTTLTIADKATIGDYAFHRTGIQHLSIGAEASIGYWAFESCDQLSELTLEGAVMEQGAFYGCDSLTEVTVPQGEIYYQVFSYCDALEKVTLGSGVTFVKPGAFFGNPALTSLNVEEGNPIYHSDGNCVIETASRTLAVGCTASVIPADGSVTVIGEEAFLECTGLTEIGIPKGVTVIDDNAFSRCTSLENIEISAGVTTIGDLAFFGCTSLKDVGISEGVTTIGVRAFSDCTSLEKIEIPAGVTTIGDRAFSGCEALADIVLPSGVTSLGWGVLSGTAYANDPANRIDGVLYYGPYLMEASEDINAFFAIRDGTTLIASSAFYYCSTLRAVVIPDSVTTVGVSAFSNCEMLERVRVPAGVLTVERAAFNSNLSAVYYAGDPTTRETNLTVDQTDDYNYDFLRRAGWYYGVSEIGEQDGWGYYVTEDGTVTVDGYAGTACDLVMPSHIDGKAVTAIRAKAFYQETAIQSMVLPDSVTSIGGAAFYECKALSDIVIGDNVTSIGYGALSRTAYYNDEANWDDGALYVGNYLVYVSYDKTGDLVIRDGTTLIAEKSCVDWQGTRMLIPSSVRTIEQGFPSPLRVDVYYGGSREEVEALGLFEEDIKQDHTAAIGESEGYLYALLKDRTVVIEGYTGDATALTVPDTLVGYPVTAIGDEAFYENTSLTSITLPDSVTAIGDRAFFDCTALSDIAVGDNIKAIGRWVVSGTAYAKDEANWSEGVLYLHTYLIGADGDIDGTVVVRDGTTLIASSAFYYCSRLRAVSIPGSVTAVGEWAFYDCYRLKDVYYDGPRSQGKFLEAYVEEDVKVHYTVVDEVDPGDINADGALDMNDAFLLYAGVSSGQFQLATTPQADYNGDGVIDMVDAFKLYARVSGG